MNFSSTKNTCLPPVVDDFSKASCKNCNFRLSATMPNKNEKCGYEYFHTPPKERKAMPLSTYPDICVDGACGHWQRKI